MLTYLNKNDISKEKKIQLIKSQKMRIIEELKKLSSKEIINYLFNSKVLVELKEVICEYVNELDSKYNNDAKVRCDEILKEFKKLNKKKESYITSDTCPNVIKKYLITELYGAKLKKVVLGNKVSNKIKANIVNLCLSSYELKNLLASSDLPINLRDYIIDKCMDNTSVLKVVLDSNDLPDDVLEDIVVKKVNSKNIFEVVKYVNQYVGDYIFKVKGKDIEDIVSSLNYRSVIKVLKNSDTPKQFYEYLFNNEYELIVKAIDNARKEEIDHLLRWERNPQIVELILERRKRIVKRIINNLFDFQLLGWLGLKHLPSEYKEYIIERYTKKLVVAIDRLDYYDAKNALNYNSALPETIQDLVYIHTKDKIVEHLKKEDGIEILRTIRFSGFIPKMKRYLIQKRIDIDNIFELLHDYYIDQETLTMVLEEKNELIVDYLNEFELDKLFKFQSKKFSKDVISKMLGSCDKLLKEKISTLSQEELFEYLDDKDTHKVVKKYMLETCCVDSNDLDNLLFLISVCDTRKMLENYDYIKKFIVDSGMDFNSFLQYGAGSKKYSKWIDNILLILKNNEVDNFNKCKNYLFKNYYNTDKENVIFSISSFLELLNSYDTHKELYGDLVSRDIKLSRNSKLDLSFLLNITGMKNEEVPSNYEELCTFKEKLYMDYYHRIEHADIDGLVKIFNNVLFGSSEKLLSCIGLSGALRTLKKDNKDSKTVCILIDELIVYCRMVEIVNDTNNVEGLRDVLFYIFSDIKILTKVQNSFAKLESKISKLYEMDSNNNLTRIKDIQDIDKYIDEVRSKEYGGTVYNFSTTNYCLYAHILSHRENINDMINGRSNAKSNFISVSPVSYRGQKYYWDRDDVILAYDYVPNGNFVCSSTSNMGSNYNISSNSSEVSEIDRRQRGILETSAVVEKNAEALLFREGLIPCGLILPGDRKPTKKEMLIHETYGLPFIITQELRKAIDDPNYVFKNNLDIDVEVEDTDELLDFIEMMKVMTAPVNYDHDYTGREIAVFADCHSMYEPTLAVLEDIRRRGITEIYSLGDNVGLGPNPVEVFDLLEEYGVKSVAGNAEYYNTLGTEPFPYLSDARLASQLWTERQLGQSRIKRLELYPASIDLTIGNKKIALCHFINDVRWDFRDRNVHSYTGRDDSNEQFLFTNSTEAIKKVTGCITSGRGASVIKGYVASREEPLFGGKMVTDYDCVLQGHAHFEIEDEMENGTEIYTLRAVGMGYEGNEKDNEACYYILRERSDGDVDVEKQYVSFNRNSLVSSIHNCSLPSKDRVLHYVKKSR